MSAPELTVAERAALLRACHCEESKLLGDMDHARDQIRLNHTGAEAKLIIVESELAILHAAIRKLWLSSP